MARRKKKLGTLTAAAEAAGVHKSTYSRQVKKLGASESQRIGKRTMNIDGGVNSKVVKRLRKNSHGNSKVN